LRFWLSKSYISLAGAWDKGVTIPANDNTYRIKKENAYIAIFLMGGVSFLELMCSLYLQICIVCKSVIENIAIMETLP
jgi:hypothetical protein